VDSSKSFWGFINSVLSSYGVKIASKRTRCKEKRPQSYAIVQEVSSVLPTIFSVSGISVETLVRHRGNISNQGCSGSGKTKIHRYRDDTNLNTCIQATIKALVELF
jgi:hypothetical protein